MSKLKICFTCSFRGKAFLSWSKKLSVLLYTAVPYTLARRELYELRARVNASRYLSLPTSLHPFLSARGIFQAVDWLWLALCVCCGPSQGKTESSELVFDKGYHDLSILFANNVFVSRLLGFQAATGFWYCVQVAVQRERGDHYGLVLIRQSIWRASVSVVSTVLSASLLFLCLAVLSIQHKRNSSWGLTNLKDIRKAKIRIFSFTLKNKNKFGICSACPWAI